ncbi:MAG: response regulator transcription factor [Ardenticatenia bacterium]|nr:response regulator transcription factor [Ardenticatenia bacterium]
MPTILLVEDDRTLREVVALNLERQGFTVHQVADGEAALVAARQHPPDLIILDVMLPKLDGLSLCRIIRAESDVPIILLTARTGEVDKIVGLESGADDYVTKPFSIGELSARIRAVLRRAKAQTATSHVLQAGPLRLDLLRWEATHAGRPLSLSPREFRLLAEFMRHPNVVLSRDLLLERVWGPYYVGDVRTVDVHVRWLRQKIEEDPSNPRWIQTVRGVGYRFSLSEEP